MVSWFLIIQFQNYTTIQLSSYSTILLLAFHFQGKIGAVNLTELTAGAGLELNDAGLVFVHSQHLLGTEGDADLAAFAPSLVNKNFEFSDLGIRRHPGYYSKNLGIVNSYSPGMDVTAY